MNFLKDMRIVHLSALKKSLQSFKKSWAIVFIGFIYVIIYYLSFAIINMVFSGVLNIIAGLLLAIVMSGLMSNYLFLLSHIIRYDKFTVTNFKDGFKIYLRKIYSILVIAWIASILFNYIGTNAGVYSSAFYTALSILIFTVFNPLPEIVYQKYYSPYESIAYSFEFMKENWFNWLLPNIIFGLILYKISGIVLTDIITQNIEYNFLLFWQGKFILNQIIVSYMMLYRGHLFSILSNSTRRKRLYMKKFND